MMMMGGACRGPSTGSDDVAEYSALDGPEHSAHDQSDYSAHGVAIKPADRWPHTCKSGLMIGGGEVW